MEPSNLVLFFSVLQLACFIIPCLTAVIIHFIIDVKCRKPRTPFCGIGPVLMAKMMLWPERYYTPKGVFLLNLIYLISLPLLGISALIATWLTQSLIYGL